MTKIILFLVLAISIQVASSTPLLKGPSKKLYASEIMVPLGNSTISLFDLSKLSIKEAEAVKGAKMSFGDRIAFKVAQHKLRHYINPDGSMNDRRMTKQLKKMSATDGFHAGGFFLGLLLGLIGLLIALLINDDKKKARVKWALIGWGIWIAIVLVSFVL